MSAKSRPIALLTDFGYRDAYVAAMKGVICSLSPGTPVVDITHEVPRHDTTSAAYLLHCAMPYFPRETIFVCVVDPGVGTGRNILCLRKGGGYVLAPDNGILGYICEGVPTESVWSLTRVPRTRNISKTFHGRDVFAPAAAMLARGRRPSSLGTRFPLPTPCALFIHPPVRSGERTRARVLHVDHFGNIITNVLAGPAGRKYTITMGRKRITTFSDTYGHAPAGKPFYLKGSTGLLEISVRNDDASKVLQTQTGDSLSIQRS